MPLPFARLPQFPMPQYRQQQRPMPGYGPDMIPQQMPPQQLGAQGTMAMMGGALVPQSSEAVPPASHPAMGFPSGDPRQFFNVGGAPPSSQYRSPGWRPPQVPANQNFPIQAFSGSPIRDDQFFHVGGSLPPYRPAPTGGFDQRAYSGESLVPSGRGNSEQPRGGAPANNGFDWMPNPITAPGATGPNRGDFTPPPQLADNTPHYGAGQGGATTFMSPGWWHAANGETVGPGQTMQANSAGWWHGNGEGQGANKAMAAGAGGGGYPVGGYGGGNPMQAFIDAQNAANAANAARANNLNEGYGAMRKYAAGLLSGLGQQDIADTNTSYDNAMSRSMNALISSGLANSTITADQYRGNARDRSSALARVQGDIADRRLNTELPLAQKQIDFNERINQNAPDPGLLAKLAQMAAAGGMGAGGGAPIMIGSGDIPYQMPGFTGYMPMPGGYRTGSLLQNGTGKFGGGGRRNGGGNAYRSGASGGSISPSNPGGGFDIGKFLEGYKGEGDINAIGAATPGGDTSAFTKAVSTYNPYNSFGPGGVSDWGRGQSQGPGQLGNGIPFFTDHGGFPAYGIYRALQNALYNSLG